MCGGGGREEYTLEYPYLGGHVYYMLPLHIAGQYVPPLSTATLGPHDCLRSQGKGRWGPRAAVPNRARIGRICSGN